MKRIIGPATASGLWVFCISASMLVWIALNRVLPLYTEAGFRVIVPWWRVVVTLSPVVIGGALFFFLFFHARDREHSQ